MSLHPPATTQEEFTERLGREVASGDVSDDLFDQLTNPDNMMETQLDAMKTATYRSWSQGQLSDDVMKRVFGDEWETVQNLAAFQDLVEETSRDIEDIDTESLLL